MLALFIRINRFYLHDKHSACNPTLFSKFESPLCPWEGLAFEINRFQVVPEFRTFYDFQASIYDTAYFTYHYAA